MFKRCAAVSGSLVLMLALLPAASAPAADCTYDKRGVGAGYEFHWSCSSHSKNTKYDWRGTYAFDVNVGGRTGRAVVANRFGYVVTTVRG